MLLDKWFFLGNRLEAILKTNLPLYGKKKQQGPSPSVGSAVSVEDYDMGDVFMVGRSLTYADILTAHLVTWFVEECGTEAMRSMPLLVARQHKVFSLPGIKEFIQSRNYYPVGDLAYVTQVSATLGRDIK